MVYYIPTVWKSGERVPHLIAPTDTINILSHWISAALATMQASLVFTPYLPIKSNKRETWADRKYLIGLG